MADFEAFDYVLFEAEVAFVGSDVNAKDLIIAGNQAGSVQGTGVVSLPVVSRIRPLSAKVVRVEFSRPMRRNSDLLNPTKYVTTPSRTARRVTVVSPSAVEVEFEEEIEDGTVFSLVVGQ